MAGLITLSGRNRLTGREVLGGKLVNMKASSQDEYFIEKNELLNTETPCIRELVSSVPHNCPLQPRDTKVNL